MKNLKERILPGIFMFFLLLFLFIVDAWMAIPILIICALLMVWEWDRLSGGGKFSWFWGVYLFGNIFISIIIFLSFDYVLSFFFLFLSSILIFCLTKNQWKAIGPLYLGVPFILMYYFLIVLPEGKLFLIWLFTINIFVDTGSYFFGGILKGPKLCPRISPKKTWSGFIGGILLSNLMAIPVLIFIEYQPIELWIMASVFLSVISVLGDIFESSIKRHYGVKDASQMIPGHGGILDRLDGLLFMLPFSFLIFLYLYKGI